MNNLSAENSAPARGSKLEACNSAWITPGLMLFCGVMTFFLVRSEFFPESSFLQQIPPRLVFEKMLRNETISTLKIEWKEEDIGSLNWRVTPGITPVLRGALQCTVPILGQKPKLNLEMMFRLLPNRAVDQFHIQGRWQDADFKVYGESPLDRIEIEVKGPDFHEKRTVVTGGILAGTRSTAPSFRITDPFLQDKAKLIRSLPDQAHELSNTLGRFRVTAANVKVERMEGEVEAYLVNARVDENTWTKIWIGLTGEFLKMESSFGLRMVNVDFFEGPTRK